MRHDDGVALGRHHLRLKADLEKEIQVSKRSRIYVIYRERGGNKLMRGNFLFGGRRAPPWTGYADEGKGQTDSGA